MGLQSIGLQNRSEKVEQMFGKENAVRFARKRTAK
jgi:hypothetical protein